MPPARRPPRVLLVNDDGPPSASSPHVFPLYTALVALGWDVTVVLPSGQRSWGSMAFTVRGHLPIWYYYPLQGNHDGSDPRTQGCWSAVRRPIDRARGEVAEWVLIDGSPATATNVGLFSTDKLFSTETHPVRRNDAPGPSTIATATSTSLAPFLSWADLCLSGPNFGRNTGRAFALSSGTLGAALSGALAGVKSIAVSYGHFQGNSGPQRPAQNTAFQGAADANTTAANGSPSSAASTTEPVRTDPNAGHIVRSPPPPEHIAQLATDLTVRIVQRLWEEWEEGVQCYSVNVPLAWTLEEPRIYWTRIWENRYPRLFKQLSPDEVEEEKKVLSEQDGPRPTPSVYLTFAPPMGSMLAPKELPQGTDIWALNNGWVSVVRLTANYEHVDPASPSLEQAWSDASMTTSTASATAAGVPARAAPGTRWML